MTTLGQIHIGARRHNYTDRRMGWRKFISVIGGLAIAWPLACYAQQPKQPLKRVGVIAALGPCPLQQDNRENLIVRRLGELGWIEGQTIVFDCVSAVGRLDQVPALARELISLRPDVLITASFAFVSALKQETTTIPIVMLSGFEPVRLGFITSLARPEGNVTGVAWFGLLPKQMELLKEIVPNMKRVAYVTTSMGLAAPVFRDGRKIREEYLQISGSALGITWQVFYAAAASDYDEIFARLEAEHFDAVNVPGLPLNLQNQTRICQLALRHRIPAVSEISDWAKCGFLLTYAQDIDWSVVRAMDYVDKILRGAKPSDLPVEQATKLLLTINFKTAKELGLTVPPSLIARADEVIE
jgi:putative ABC transport system substrate-binding protein